MRDPLTVQARDLTFLPADEERLSRELLSEFPNIRFYSTDSYECAEPWWPRFETSLRDCPGVSVEFFLMPPGWKPDVRPKPPGTTAYQRPGAKSVHNIPLSGGLFQRLHTYRLIDGKIVNHWQGMPGYCRVHLNARRDEPGDMAFLKGFYRALRRAATNKLMLIRTPEDRFRPRVKDWHCDQWAGREAVLWCREDATRTMHGNSFYYVPADLPWPHPHKAKKKKAKAKAKAKRRASRAG